MQLYKPESFTPGFCCVINPSLIKGDELVRWFSEQEIDSYDFLLPDGNYTNYPDHWTGAAAYTEFLIAAFDEWFNMGVDAARIRKFELMISGMFGHEVTLDALGGDLKQICVVESDGGITANDVTRICGGIFSTDKINIYHDELDFHAKYFDLDELQELSDTCKACKFVKSCGGGYLPHRFDGSSFKNPSIYCEALYALSEHIFNTIQPLLSSARARQTQ